jgi:hypothetical protein
MNFDPELTKAILNAVWPLTILVIVLIFASRLKNLVSAFVSRLEGDDAIKIGSIEFQGVRIRGEQQSHEQGADVFDEDSIEDRAATKEDFELRKQYRYASRFVRLVHSVSSSGDKRYPLKVLVYVKIEKILPKLAQDRDFTPARLNDIDYVEYYLGKYFGHGEWGSWFVVRDGERRFAIEYLAEDEVSCIAKVHFHDGTEIELRRYLDLEMGRVVGAMESQLKDKESKLKEIEGLIKKTK